MCVCHRWNDICVLLCRLVDFSLVFLLYKCESFSILKCPLRQDQNDFHKNNAHTQRCRVIGKFHSRRNGPLLGSWQLNITSWHHHLQAWRAYLHFHLQTNSIRRNAKPLLCCTALRPKVENKCLFPDKHRVNSNLLSEEARRALWLDGKRLNRLWTLSGHNYK